MADIYNSEECPNNLFATEIIFPLLNSIKKFSSRNAFLFGDNYYSYKELGECISRIRISIRNQNINDKNIGLVINDDLATYSSIFALWLEGKAYVPLHPGWPIERTKEIIDQVGMALILDSSTVSRYNKKIVLSTNIPDNLHKSALSYNDDISDKNLAYILFTSGSTGTPKGVQVSRKNLSSFVRAFFDLGLNITENDRVLQCFDLTFDLSIMSYLIPLLRGACVYTVPNNQIKYSYISGLMDDYQLTVALMAPSTIRYLKPYFDEINCPSMKYSLFCGEALTTSLTAEWSKCVPNSRIFNVYGPTEDTIFCSSYEYIRNGRNKEHNGILSIGRTMNSGNMIIIDDKGNITKNNELGELCLSGKQLSPGYLNNPEKNKESFFIRDGIVFYRSGDICYRDSDGDIMYSGRMDHQVKIQGFRIELGEIEFHASTFLKGKNIVCMAFENEQKLTEIAMFVESKEFDTKSLLDYMFSVMPSYMIPTRIIFVEKFPLNSNGKIDRNRLKLLINE
jgi:D-alanine--poly(phosphoribitol) ligase subunit 1